MRPAALAERPVGRGELGVFCSVLTIERVCLGEAAAGKEPSSSRDASGSVGGRCRCRLAPQKSYGRRGPRRVAGSEIDPITQSGRGPRTGAAGWVEDRGRMAGGNEARAVGRAGDRSGIGEDRGTQGDGPVAIALGHGRRHCRKRDRPGFRSRAPRSRASAATAVSRRGVGAPMPLRISGSRANASPATCVREVR